MTLQISVIVFAFQNPPQCTRHGGVNAGGKAEMTSSQDEDATRPHLELTTFKQSSKVQPTIFIFFFLLKTVLGRVITIKYETRRIPHVLSM